MIRAKEVRLIDSQGKQVGIVPLEKALEMAQQEGVDLVEVAPLATPPVCRLMDYGKYKYEEKKQAVQKRQRAQLVKEVNFRPNIGEHDFEFKVAHIVEFLQKGHKAKVRVFFRGREIIHPELGTELMNRIKDRVAHVGAVDVPAKLEGKNMIMILAPKKKD